jgi:IclR family transcriptional regulator, acetate operon repressor
MAEGSGRRDDVQVLARAADILRRLASEPGALSPIALADSLGLARTTAYRIVRTLVKEGFVQVAEDGKLSIGSGLVGLVMSGRRDLHAEAAPFLTRLRDELGETVDLSVLDGDEVLFVDQFPSSERLRVMGGVGGRLSLHSNASGKALLAALTPDKAERLLPVVLEPLTEHTLCDRAVLLAEVDEARRTGLTRDHEEASLGIAALGTWIDDPLGSGAAITVVMPATRLAAKEAHVAAALLRTREELRTVLKGA